MTTLERGTRLRVRTAQGSVQADLVVLCGNAYLNHLVPELVMKIMPMGNYIGATAPLEAARAKALFPSDAAVW